MKNFNVQFIGKNSDVDKIVFNHKKVMEQILEGITDATMVCDINKSVVFYNETVCKSYNADGDNCELKKCYEMLNRNSVCENCCHEKAIKTKRFQKAERYVPENNKFMECNCKPILDDDEEVIFVVKQLKEITEKKILEDTLRKSEEKYQDIFNLLPESVVVVVEGKIVLANERATEICGKLIGKNIFDVEPKLQAVIKTRINQILRDKKRNAIFDYKITDCNERKRHIEVSSSYITYNGKPAVVSIMRDITKMKNGLISAARIQKIALQRDFPLEDKAHMETVYMPAKTVSGDFFHINKVDEDVVVGIIADVRGKGITAALNISACNVLFNEAVLVNDDPETIINYLNKKIVTYLGESYVAACCFRLDFKNKVAKVVGAGINEFIFQEANGTFENMVVKGPFLGMFEDSMFDEVIINFGSKDRFYFFTDGLEFILEDKIKKEYCKGINIIKLKEYLSRTLSDMLTDVDGIKDDCTLVALEIK